MYLGRNLYNFQLEDSHVSLIQHLADLCGRMVEFPVNTNLQFKESSLWGGNPWFYVF